MAQGGRCAGLSPGSPLGLHSVLLDDSQVRLSVDSWDSLYSLILELVDMDSREVPVSGQYQCHLVKSGFWGGSVG